MATPSPPLTRTVATLMMVPINGVSPSTGGAASFEEGQFLLVEIPDAVGGQILERLLQEGIVLVFGPGQVAPHLLDVAGLSLGLGPRIDVKAALLKVHRHLQRLFVGELGGDQIFGHAGRRKDRHGVDAIGKLFGALDGNAALAGRDGGVLPADDVQVALLFFDQ